MRKIAIAVFALASVATVCAKEFKAGFARRDVTPPFGIFMPGYFKQRHAKSVLDPLQINCVALSDGKKTAFVMQIDTESLSDYVADKMRDAIVDATGVARDAILLHASHTHDGGQLTQAAEFGTKTSAKTERLAGLYSQMATSRAADAAVEAIRDLKPAKLSYQRSFARRISFGRRYLMKDGKVRTNPGTNNPDIVRPAGEPPDESVQVLRIDREDALPICMINFQTHPDVVGGETITADWPGLTRTVFEAATLGKARCIVINGTQGDVNHCNVMPKPGELNGLKRDFDDVDRGYEHSWHMANVIAAAALSVWLKCVPLDAGDINYRCDIVRVPAQKAKDTDEKNLAWANMVWKMHTDGKDSEITRKFGWAGMELTTEVARAGRIRKMASHADFHDLPIYAVTIGKSVAFGGFQGEPFNDIGKAVKKNSPFTLTILSCLTNGSRGYFPFSDAYVGGGYESATSPFGPSVADDLIAGQLKLLEDLAK